MAVEQTNADGTNTLGLRLTDYIQAIKYKCHQYNIEFVDLYGVTGLDPDTNTNNFQSDGLHPTASGHIALKDYLLKIFIFLSSSLVSLLVLVTSSDSYTADSFDSLIKIHLHFLNLAIYFLILD